MKNITLSADEQLIEKARAKARSENTTLNNRFREWLEGYTQTPKQKEEEYRKLMSELGHVEINRKFSREEMNER